MARHQGPIALLRRSDTRSKQCRQGTVRLVVSVVGWLLLLCGLFLAFMPTRAQVRAAPTSASQTVQCGVPVVVVYGRPFAGRTPLAAAARIRCQAKAKPRVLAAEITVPIGAAVLGGTGLWRRVIHPDKSRASVPEGRRQ